MPPRAPRLLTLLLATAGVCLTATAAGAQSAPSTTRHLTWANRPAGTTPANVIAEQARVAEEARVEEARVEAQQARVRNPIIPRRIAPSQAPYRPMMQPASAPQPVSRGLTPASAWLGPRVAPAFAPGSPEPLAYTEMASASPAPAPVMTAAPARTVPAPVRTAPPPAPAPVYAPPPPPVPTSAPAPTPIPVEPVAADPMAPRRDAPVFNLRRSTPSTVQAPEAPVAAPAEAPTSQPQPVAAADTIDDPMAPRRDAPIFQMQAAQPQGQAQAALTAPTQPAPAAVQGAQSGARYYSVHRDAGRRPDPTTLPAPVYFDSVTLDLAEPPAQAQAQQEQPVRDAQGRRRAIVPNEDPSLP